MPSVSLTPAMEKAIEEAVAAGEYASVSEVVREGVRLWLQSRERDVAAWRELAAEIDLGWRQLDRGEWVAYGMDDVIGRGRP